LASEALMMSGMRIHRASRWTEDDDNLLRTLAEAGKSLTILGVKLNRPMTAVKSRAQDLGIRIAGTEIGERRKRKHILSGPQTVALVSARKSWGS
jgi:hypothetical protein